MPHWVTVSKAHENTGMRKVYFRTWNQPSNSSHMLWRKKWLSPITAWQIAVANIEQFGPQIWGLPPTSTFTVWEQMPKSTGRFLIWCSTTQHCARWAPTDSQDVSQACCARGENRCNFCSPIPLSNQTQEAQGWVSSMTGWPSDSAGGPGALMDLSTLTSDPQHWRAAVNLILRYFFKWKSTLQV